MGGVGQSMWADFHDHGNASAFSSSFCECLLRSKRKSNNLNQMVVTSPRTLPLNPMVKANLRNVTDSKAEDIDCLGMTPYLWSL